MRGLFFLFLLIACSSGSENGSNDSPVSLPTGFFIDSPVEGLEYTSTSQQGVRCYWSL